MNQKEPRWASSFLETDCPDDAFDYPDPIEDDNTLDQLIEDARAEFFDEWLDCLKEWATFSQSYQDD